MMESEILSASRDRATTNSISREEMGWTIETAAGDGACLR